MLNNQHLSTYYCTVYSLQNLNTQTAKHFSDTKGRKRADSQDVHGASETQQDVTRLLKW